MKQAIIFGAGNIGRGFIGQLFSESGYRITFVDIDSRLLEALNRRGAYTIRMVTNEATEEISIGPVRGISAHDRAAVAQAVAEAEVGATAVGAGALKDVAPAVAAGIARRVELDIDAPLNLILCENLKDAARTFRQMVQAALPAHCHPYLAGRVGFVDTVIGRMVPLVPAELREQDPSMVIVEPYKELPVDAAGFVGSLPSIVGLTPVSPFSFYTERKLYIHNAGHAVLGYLGYQHGYEYAYQALLDTEIAATVRGAMGESQQALERKYGLIAGALADFVEDLLVRVGNRALGDTTFRLARDPIRKLARNDRLIGAALNALAYDVEPVYLVEGIVAALHSDSPDDPVAGQLQERLRQAGIDIVLQEVCGLEPKSPLFELIKRRWFAVPSGPSSARR